MYNMECLQLYTLHLFLWRHFMKPAYLLTFLPAGRPRSSGISFCSTIASKTMKPLHSKVKLNRADLCTRTDGFKKWNWTFFLLTSLDKSTSTVSSKQKAQSKPGMTTIRAVRLGSSVLRQQHLRLWSSEVSSETTGEASRSPDWKVGIICVANEHPNKAKYAMCV